LGSVKATLDVDALINIDVSNLEQAIRFYEAAVGLRLRRKLFGGTVAEMIGASSPIYLITKPQGSSPIPEPNHGRTYERHWTPVHLDFVVVNLEMAIQKAERAGAKLELAPQSFDWGRLATLSDPFGHGLCLLQWSDGGYDEAA
jgi:predicted enzyme related to lactoylglutathione lyase